MDLIAPAPEGALVATPVSKHVNKVKNDDPECLVPVTRMVDDAQGRLF